MSTPSDPPKPQPPPASPSPSAPPGGRNRGREDENPMLKEMRQLLECPVCLLPVAPPILQCSNGHVICNSCQPKVRVCPSCRVDVPSPIRSLLMEKLAETVTTSCSNNGCSFQDTYAKVLLHERGGCPYGDQRCPFGSPSWTKWTGKACIRCDWVGSVEQMAAHFHAKHREFWPVGVDPETKYEHLARDGQHVLLADYSLVLACGKDLFMCGEQPHPSAAGFVGFTVAQLNIPFPESKYHSFHLAITPPKGELMNISWTCRLGCVQTDAEPKLGVHFTWIFVPNELKTPDKDLLQTKCLIRLIPAAPK